MVHRIEETLKWTVCLWCGRFFYYNENSNSEHSERKFCNLNKDDNPSNVCAVSYFRADDGVRHIKDSQRDMEIECIESLDVLPIAPICESPATGRDYGRYYGRESKLKEKKQKQGRAKKQPPLRQSRASAVHPGYQGKFVSLWSLQTPHDRESCRHGGHAVFCAWWW